MKQAIQGVMLATAALTLAGCANNAELTDKVDLGNFELGFAVVVADNARKGPFSRDATPEQIEEAVSAEIDRRFSRYEGGKSYHLGVSIDGYIIAEPGIPVIASPKSALFASVTLWDDAAQAKMNEEPKQIVVLESFSSDLVVGSGLTMEADEQLENISQNLVKEIEDWLNNRPEWFDDPVEGGIPFDEIQTERSRAEELAAAGISVPGPEDTRPAPRPDQG
ncbi:hypothetical protein [Tropicimonas sp. S265A]|uniref:hypothetical protein n=1 Tax=Tropicimonas sp. S265A TaxID=3415134 RepID=UPI003C7B1063